MRRNSGDDEGRNRFLDPTMKEHEAERGKSGAAVIDKDARKGPIGDNAEQETTGMGSNADNSRAEADRT